MPPERDGRSPPASAAYNNLWGKRRGLLSRRIARGSNMPSLTVHGALRAVISLPMLWAPLMITVVTFAAPAAAQETPAENAPLQEVVVTGIRRTIEQRTLRPLEYGRRAAAFNVRGERNSDSSLGADSTDKGYRVSFSYIDQYADNNVGLTFGLARLNSPLTTEGYGTYEPWSANGAGIFTT